MLFSEVGGGDHNADQPWLYSHGDNGFGRGFGFVGGGGLRPVDGARFQATGNISITSMSLSTVDSRTTGRGLSSPVRILLWLFIITTGILMFTWQYLVVNFFFLVVIKICLWFVLQCVDMVRCCAPSTWRCRLFNNILSSRALPPG